MSSEQFAGLNSVKVHDLLTQAYSGTGLSPFPHNNVGTRATPSSSGKIGTSEPVDYWAGSTDAQLAPSLTGGPKTLLTTDGWSESVENINVQGAAPISYQADGTSIIFIGSDGRTLEEDTIDGNTLTVHGYTQKHFDDITKAADADITGGTSSASDIAQYVQEQTSNVQTYMQVRSQMAHSNAGQAAINQLYQSVLNRGADSSGMTANENGLTAGMTLSDVRTSMAMSAEAQQDLKNIISNVQGRTATSGDDSWVAAQQQAIANGESMAQVQSDLAHYSGEQAVVNSVFQAALGRGASQSDITTWENYLGGGGNFAQMRNWIAYGSESQQNINSAYQIFLDRTPSSSEVGADEAFLNNGGTVDQIRQGAMTSDEAHANALNALMNRFGISMTDAEVTQAQNGLATVWNDPNSQYQDNINNYLVSGYTTVQSYPPNSFTWTTPSGVSVVIPNGYSYTAEFEAGQATSSNYNPLSLKQATGADIGTFGRFDPQHDTAAKATYTQRIDAGNYGVGVYMRGAGWDPVTMMVIGTAYSLINSGQLPTLRAMQMWSAGYVDAMNGNYK